MLRIYKALTLITIKKINSESEKITRKLLRKMPGKMKKIAAQSEKGALSANP